MSDGTPAAAATPAAEGTPQAAPAAVTPVAAAPAAAAPVAAPAAAAEGTPAAAAAAAAAAEGAPPAEGEKTPEGEAPKGAPEAYTPFVSPEGTTLDTTLDTEFKDLAKSLDLSQEDAQKIIDIGAKITHAGVKAQMDSAAAIRDGWAAEAKADKDFGGDKFPENIAVAKAAMLATTTPEMQGLLERSGLGNHPEFIRHFLTIAPAFSADKLVPGGKSPGADKSTSKVLYPNNA